MLRPLAFAALILLPAPVVQANEQDSQLYALVSRELPIYVSDVDVASLSQHQLGAIYSILHSGRSGGDKVAMIRSVLGGRFSLRGLFLN